MINIGIFNEHRLSLEGTCRLLLENKEFNVLFTCDERAGLREKMKPGPVHVLLLTMHEISINSVNIIVQLCIENPKTRILVMSLTDSEEIILKTIKAGAKGFLGPESSYRDLVEAIYTIRSGHDYFSKSITQLLLNRYIKNLKEDDNSTENDLSSLSARQVEILKFWGNGFSNQEIAEKLFISIRTVESHKNHIMQKLNLKNTVDLVKFGIKNNIIEI
ncbi:MAG: response regulator transcription factor [Prolixibacteraceae bacterium]|nr:response regulator transcription factor [Prolixibacteraceae bacterium]